MRRPRARFLRPSAALSDTEGTTGRRVLVKVIKTSEPQYNFRPHHPGADI